MLPLRSYSKQGKSGCRCGHPRKESSHLGGGSDALHPNMRGRRQAMGPLPRGTAQPVDDGDKPKVHVLCMSVPLPPAPHHGEARPPLSQRSGWKVQELELTPRASET